VSALQGLKESHTKKEAIIEDPTLLNTFEQGLRVAVVTYADNDDMTLRRAWNVGKHDEENNTVRWSSVHLRITVAKEMHAYVGDWPAATKELCKRFSFSESTVRRWSRCAAGMDASVLEFLGKEEYEFVKGQFIWDNECLMGTGVKTRSKLEFHFATAAIRILAEKDGDIVAKVFVERVCAPLKVLEVWDKLMRKRYGTVCALSSAYTRLVTKLETYDGLQLVAATMTAGIPLHGFGPGNPGIADCHALVQEFDRCRAGGLPPPSRMPTAEELAKEAEMRKKADEDARRAEQEAREKEEAQARELAQQEELDHGWLPMATPMVVDDTARSSTHSAPAMASAEAEQAARLAQDLGHVVFQNTPEALAAALREPLSRCSRAAVIIVAPTSGWAVISNYMQQAADLLQVYKSGCGGTGSQHKMRILILPGSRWDVIAKVQEKAKSVCLNHALFVTQLQRKTSQTWTSRPSFALTLVEKTDIATGVPAALTVPKASTKDVLQEGLQLRCNCKSCPFRPTGGAEPGPGDILHSEIDVEDRIPTQFELMQAELAEAEADDGATEVDDSGPGVSAGPRSAEDIDPQFLVELWPFAFGSAYWNTLFAGLLEAEKAQVMIILTPSAHPGPWVVARRLQLDVFVSTRRCSAHAQRHGMQIGEGMRSCDLTPSASSPELQQSQRSECPYIRGAVVGDSSVLEAYDVAPGVSWRDGLNLQVSGDALAKGSARLVAEQLDTGFLAVSAVDAKIGRSLETTRMLRDGDVLPASALFFDEEPLLLSWLQQPGNDKYCDRVVAIPGVKKVGEPRTIFAVLVGAAQYANNYLSIRKAPNAKLVFTPSRGFNEGSLQIHICTRNGAGVAKGSPILLDYGPEFQAPQRSGGDTFRGALDAVFGANRLLLPDEAAEHDETSNKEREQAAVEEAAVVAEAEAKRKAEEQLQQEKSKNRRRLRRQKSKKSKRRRPRPQSSQRPCGGTRQRLLVNALAAPKCELRLVDAKKSLAIVSLETSSKKIAKHTLLAKWSENSTLSTRVEAGVAWSVQPKDLIFCKESESCMTLAKAFKEHYQAFGLVFGYVGFPVG